MDHFSGTSAGSNGPAQLTRAASACHCSSSSQCAAVDGLLRPTAAPPSLPAWPAYATRPLHAAPQSYAEPPGSTSPTAAPTDDTAGDVLLAAVGGGKAPVVPSKDDVAAGAASPASRATGLGLAPVRRGDNSRGGGAAAAEGGAGEEEEVTTPTAGTPVGSARAWGSDGSNGAAAGGPHEATSASVTPVVPGPQHDVSGAAVVR